MLLRVGLWFVVFLHKPQRASNSPQIKERPKIPVFSEFLILQQLGDHKLQFPFSFPAAAKIRREGLSLDHTAISQ